MQAIQGSSGTLSAAFVEKIGATQRDQYHFQGYPIMYPIMYPITHTHFSGRLYPAAQITRGSPSAPTRVVLVGGCTRHHGSIVLTPGAAPEEGYKW